VLKDKKGVVHLAVIHHINQTITNFSKKQTEPKKRLPALAGQDPDLNLRHHMVAQGRFQSSEVSLILSRHRTGEAIGS
jgi:hypothetical protein